MRAGNYFPTIFQIIYNFEETNPAIMLKKLLSQLFYKLEDERDNDKKTKNGNAIYFVEEILETKFGRANYISSKAIKAYFDKYVEKKENNAGEPSSELKNLIAQYLGYDDFLDFENKNKSIEGDFSSVKRDEEFLKKNVETKVFTKLIITIGVIIILFSGLYYKGMFTNKEDCYIWKENHYLKISSSEEKQNLTLICGQNSTVEKFRQVIITDTTTFFIKGQPIIWYGKSNKGELEYFNSRGVHPVTKNELKPITEYIIKKYVYKNE